MSDASRTPGDVQREVIDAARRTSRQAVTTQQRLARSFVHSADDQLRAQRRATAAFVSALALPTEVRATTEDSDPASRSGAAYRNALTSMEEVTDDWWTLAYRSATDAAETYDGMLGASADFADAWYEAAASATDWTEAMTATDWTEAMGWLPEAEDEPVAIDVEGGEG